MPLQPQLVQVQIGGVEQRSGSTTRRPGSLDRAVNIVYDKMGDGVRISKRRGYRYVAPSDVVGTTTPDVLMMHVTTRAGELVVVTHDQVLGLGSRVSGLRGEDALVYRGPCNRGNVRLMYVSTARTSRLQPNDVDPE